MIIQLNVYSIMLFILKLIAENSIIRSDEVESVMTNVDRAKYVNHNPYMDVPQGIGYGVTISAPHMVRMPWQIFATKLFFFSSHLPNYL